MTQDELQRASELNERLEVIDRMCHVLRREGMDRIEVTLANAEDDALVDHEGVVLEGKAVREFLEAQRVLCQGALVELGVSVTA